MPSLTCSALYWRRSIRSLRALQTEGGSGEMKQQDKEAGREGRRNIYLGASCLGHFPVTDLNTSAALIYCIILPLGHWIPSIRSLFLPRRPCMSGINMIIYSFVRRRSCLQKLLPLWGKNTHLNSSIYLFFLFFLFLGLSAIAIRESYFCVPGLQTYLQRTKDLGFFLYT